MTKLFHGLLYSVLILVSAGLWTETQGLASTNQLLVNGQLRVVSQDIATMEKLKNHVVDLRTQLEENKIAAEVRASNHSLPIDKSFQIARAIIKYSVQEKLDISLVVAVMNEESRFDPNVISFKGAMGLMQVMPFWAGELEFVDRRDDLLEIDTNIRAGTRILRIYMDEFHQDRQLALLAYNRGPAPVRLALIQNRSPENGYAMAILHHQRMIQSNLGTF